MLHLILATAALATVLPPPVARCRCAQLSIGQYFAAAEIVLIGRARTVRRVPADDSGPERLEIEFTPLYSANGPFKGSVHGTRFVTPTDPAACGVPVVQGSDYVIFASRHKGGNSGEAHFDSCSGSRNFRPDDASLFLGLSADLVVPRLLRLAEAASATSWQESYHTSPACWREPRIYHQGTLPPPLGARVSISRTGEPFPDVEGVVSPNRAYRAWTPPPSERATAGDAAVVLVDVERPELLRIEVTAVTTAPTLNWVSEKLLFFRLMHGRVQFTDLLLDVESGELLYQESARYGDLAHQQFQQACGGRCPCPTSGPAGEN